MDKFLQIFGKFVSFQKKFQTNLPRDSQKHCRINNWRHYQRNSQRDRWVNSRKLNGQMTIIWNNLENNLVRKQNNWKKNKTKNKLPLDLEFYWNFRIIYQRPDAESSKFRTTVINNYPLLGLVIAVVREQATRLQPPDRDEKLSTPATPTLRDL